MAFIKQIQRANTVYEITPQSVAAQFDSTESYAVGDYVYFDGQLYKCTTAHTGAFVSSDFTAVTVGEELASISGGGGDGLTEDIKQALLQIAEKVAYIDASGQTYYQALYDALYPPADLVSISAVYTQSGTVYDTDSLDDLKDDLVVTATYDDSTTQTVTAYTLSGSLTVGTSTITVAYGGMTDTFTVTVTATPASAIYDWDLTSSMTDSVGSVVATTNGTQDENGVTFTGSGKYIEFGGVMAVDRTYEIDVDHIARSSSNLSRYARLFMVDADSNTATGGNGYIISGTAKSGDLFYMGTWDTNVIVSNSIDVNGSYYDGSTVGFYISSDKHISVYKDGVLLGTSTSTIANTGTNIYIGSTGSDYFDDALFTGLRVYGGNIYA